MALARGKREITKEQYERGMANKGWLTSEDSMSVFSEAERWGYGVYCAMVKAEDGKYYVTYDMGTSCD